jgi:hypothetical protein
VTFSRDVPSTKTTIVMSNKRITPRSARSSGVSATRGGRSSRLVGRL